MPNLTDKLRVVDGDSRFTGGMNSLDTPIALTDSFYRSSMNMVNRGGVLQTRPGYEYKFTMPAGNLQGGIMFRPSSGFEFLVFAVEGLVYSSQYPFKTCEQIVGLEFRSDVTDIYFCTAEKGSQVQSDDTVKLITPFKLVIIQDGYTPPGIWDGSSAQHLLDANETPIGSVMAWSGNRLWVAREQEIFASDIFDPTSFREGTYLSNAKSFLLEKPVTAMVEVTTKNIGQLVAFTDTSATLFQSNIRKRSTWDTTDQFQAVLLPEIGCVAHRSIVTMHGLLWWYSAFGLTNLNAALSSYVTSEFSYQDNEMAISKGFLSPRQSTIACAVFENYLLTSVPHADVFNSHTWVIDKAPGDTVNVDSPSAWNSYWTGTRPVAWAFGYVQGVNRIFQFSKDYDGNNRCWEAFSDDRTDAGAPIVWSMETRGYSNKSITKKKFRFAEVDFTELSGQVDVGVYWAGTSRGAYKSILQKRFVANTGVIDSAVELDYDDSVLYSLKKQSRLVRTNDVANSPTDKTSCNIESPDAEWYDAAFQLLIVGSGQAAVSTIRMFMDLIPENTSGDCVADETLEENNVRFDGRAADNLEELDSGPLFFTAEKTVHVVFEDESFDAIADAVSTVSQADADKQAQDKAQSVANFWLASKVPYIVGDPSQAIVPTP